MKEILNKIKQSTFGKWVCQHSSFSWACVFSLITIIIYSFLCFHENIWYDEAYQMVLNRYSLKEIIYFVSRDFSPPLYAICLKIFTTIFGSSLDICRCFSLFTYCSLFFLAFFPIQKLFTKKVSFIFSIFLILLPVSSYISLEIRTYCFAFVFTLYAVVYGALLLKENTWKDMLLFILFSTLAMYSHNYSIFAIFIFLIIEFITSLFLKKARLKTLLSLILTILLFIPWLNVLLNQAQALNENFWISSPNLAVLFHCLYFIFGSHKYLVLIIIDILLIFLFWGIYKKPRTVIQALYIFLPSFLSLLFFILWSIYKTPMFIPRYMVPVLGGILLFLACICSIPKKNYLLIILILILVFPFFNNYKEEILKTDDTPTKEMIKYIENNSEEEKNFLHIGEFSLGEMEYYFPNSNHFYYESVPIYVTVSEIYGKTHMLSLKEKLPKEKYILVSQVPFSDFEKRFNLTVVNQQTFIIPYQGTRYVYILNPINE